MPTPRLHLLIALGFLTSFASAEPKLVHLGVLQPEPARAAELQAAGVNLVVLSLSWDLFQPAPDRFDSAYLKKLRADIEAYQAAGLGIILDTGIQYPPKWLRDQPHARYQNQYGATYVDPAPGKNIVNSVFNAQVRGCQLNYIAGIFRHLGKDWAGVRLGGGWYGEINYPSAWFAEKDNCYWAFDPIAQGKEQGLPSGMTPCPVPDWKPGSASLGNISAKLFSAWYLQSLQNYHDWQISTLRHYYDGPLMMLYPSWGIRSGQLDAAVSNDLSGATPPEKNGEIQRGFDFARFIAGICDPQVWVQCTWLDSNPAWSDDTSADPVRWSPPKYLAHLARQHTPPLRVSAENTGGGGMPALELSTQRIQELTPFAVFWAFGPDLFDGIQPDLNDIRVNILRLDTEAALP